MYMYILKWSYLFCTYRLIAWILASIRDWWFYSVVTLRSQITTQCHVWPRSEFSLHKKPFLLLIHVYCYVAVLIKKILNNAFVIMTRLLTMEFYGSQDITLGGFLEKFCFRWGKSISYKCMHVYIVHGSNFHQRKLYGIHGIVVFSVRCILPIWLLRVYTGLIDIFRCVLQRVLFLSAKHVYVSQLWCTHVGPCPTNHQQYGGHLYLPQEAPQLCPGGREGPDDVELVSKV